MLIVISDALIIVSLVFPLAQVQTLAIFVRHDTDLGQTTTPTALQSVNDCEIEDRLRLEQSLIKPQRVNSQTISDSL